MDSEEKQQQSLNFSQVSKLNTVLSTQMEIQSHNNFPALQVSPAGLIKVVKNNLLKCGISIGDIRMNGSAASYCICEDSDEHPTIRYNDIDLIFGVGIREDSDFHVIKDVVMSSLLEFLPEVVSRSNISSQLMEETYVRKMVLVSNRNNRWSLVSLGDSSPTSTTIELKFVDRIRRKYEFTVDSFQILIDSYFDFSKCAEESPVAMCRTFFPTVPAISVYRSYEEALDHLNNRLIHTEAPEEIRGGGLLKYCSLLTNGFTPADPEKMLHLEPYMCSRFFIDFPTEEVQYNKIEKYVTSRFVQSGEGGMRKGVEFLDNLYRVVSSRAKCLVESERRKTIGVIVYIRNMLALSLGEVFAAPPPPPQSQLAFHHIVTGYPHHHHHHHSNQYQNYYSHYNSSSAARRQQHSPPPPPPATQQYYQLTSCRQPLPSSSYHHHHHRRAHWKAASPTRSLGAVQ